MTGPAVSGKGLAHAYRPQYQRSLEQFETDLLLEAVCDCIVKKKQGLSLGKF